MKSNLRAILVTVIALALCLTALMPATFAETADNSFSVTLHGRVQLRGGSIPKSKMDRFLIRLTPADKECPMPKGSSDYFDAEARSWAFIIIRSRRSRRTSTPI